MQTDENRVRLTWSVSAPANYYTVYDVTYKAKESVVLGTVPIYVVNAGDEAAYTIKYGNVDMGSNLYALERTPVFHTENTMQSFYERLRYRPLFEEFGWKKR